MTPAWFAASMNGSQSARGATYVGLDMTRVLSYLGSHRKATYESTEGCTDDFARSNFDRELTRSMILESLKYLCHPKGLSFDSSKTVAKG
jgi:hypothetical protein